MLLVLQNKEKIPKKPVFSMNRSYFLKAYSLPLALLSMNIAGIRSPISIRSSSRVKWKIFITSPVKCNFSKKKSNSIWYAGPHVSNTCKFWFCVMFKYWAGKKLYMKKNYIWKKIIYEICLHHLTICFVKSSTAIRAIKTSSMFLTETLPRFTIAIIINGPRFITLAS